MQTHMNTERQMRTWSRYTAPKFGCHTRPRHLCPLLSPRRFILKVCIVTSSPPAHQYSRCGIGSPLYLASSVFVRHTLNALYSDLHVELRRVSLRPQGSSPNLPTSTGAGELQEGAGKKRKNREKSLDIGLVVTGTARVSGSPGQWEV